MFNSKKFLLIVLFGLNIPFNGFAATKEQTHHKESVKVHIDNFDPKRDTGPVIEIFNKNSNWLGCSSSSYYQDYVLKYSHSDPLCSIKILRENEDLAGYIIYKHGLSSRGRITDLAVAENFRNKGYGKLLLLTAIEELSNMGSEEIRLGCFTKNISALNLYKKIGFKTEGAESEIGNHISIRLRYKTNYRKNMQIKLGLIQI